MSTYLCGIDIGGTFTDCVVVDEAGRVTTGKAPSTPSDFGEGMIAAIDIVAGKLGTPLDALCRIPKVSGEFVARMEDVLELYGEDYDPECPVVCFDETSKQLIEETRTPIAPRAGRLKRL